MGVIYAVAPIDLIADWVAEQNLPIPANAKTIQMPTPALILEALHSLGGLELKPVNTGQSHQIEFDLTRYDGTEWTTIHLNEVTADNEPCTVTFSRGHEPLMEAILAKLAATCGPLVLFPDYAANIRIITKTGPYAG